jgi:hypothetical protein
MSTKCGGYNTSKSPSDDSKNVLKINFNNIVCLHEKLTDLDLDHLLENHTYATQVVAGLNYKFSFVVGEHDVVVVVWKKLNDTFEVSLKDLSLKK